MGCHSEPSRRLGEEPAVFWCRAEKQFPHRAFGPIRNDITYSVRAKTLAYKLTGTALAGGLSVNGST
jgi:hypothetical protein